MPKPLEVLSATLLVFSTPGLLTGCDATPPPQPELTPISQSDPMGKCEAVLRSYEGGTNQHYAECSAVKYSTSPPVFGDHYPVWAAYQSYDFPLPLGYLVHDLEHGAVVLFYDCPDGCADEVAGAEDFILALPDDPRCAPDVRVQVILVPEPGLGSRWAAASWGNSLSADCFDPEVFARFYADHHGHGIEDLCNQGTVFTHDPCD